MAIILNRDPRQIPKTGSGTNFNAPHPKIQVAFKDTIDEYTKS